ncbi:hypothetical protein [Nostoc sp.]
MQDALYETLRVACFPAGVGVRGLATATLSTSRTKFILLVDS